MRSVVAGAAGIGRSIARSESSIAFVTGAEAIDGPTHLTLYDGQRASVSVAKQTAYVSDFELTAVDGGTIADPCVATVAEGVLFVATATQRGAAGTTAIELELTVCKLDHPFTERSVALFEHAPPVAIQVPNGISRRLISHSDLGRDEALVFGGLALPVDARGRVLIAVLRAEPLESK